MISGLQIKNYSDKDIQDRIVGSAVAVGVSRSLKPVVRYVSNTVSDNLIEKLQQITEEETEILNKATNDAIKLSHMDKYGVRVQFLKMPEQRKSSSQCKNMYEQIQNGYNCAFTRFAYKGIPAKTILMPEKGHSLSGFHELGHAISETKPFGKFIIFTGRMINKIRPYKTASMIAIYGALTEKSTNSDGSDLNTLQKTNNFIRNNAGKISASFMIPRIIDEAMASINGQKLANKLLNKKLSGRVAKNNLIGFSTYLVHAGLLAGISASAVKIKDAFCEK